MGEPNIAAIAGTLTEAQREWLLAAEPTLDKVAKEACAEWWDHPEQLHVEIDGIDYWLACRSMHSPAGSPKFIDACERLTETGLAVRAHLLATQEAEHG